MPLMVSSTVGRLNCRSHLALPEGQAVSVIVKPVASGAEKLPPGEGLRRAFGAWADEATELDEFLAETRRLRQRTASGDRRVSFLLDTDICSAYMKGDGRIQTRFHSIWRRPQHVLSPHSPNFIRGRSGPRHGRIGAETRRIFSPHVYRARRNLSPSRGSLRRDRSRLCSTKVDRCRNSTCSSPPRRWSTV